MTHVCPNCNRVYSRMKHSGDYIHECNSDNATLDNEDVKVISPTVDEFGDSNKSTGRTQGGIFYQGSINRLQGTKTYARTKADIGDRTSRGANASTTRSRQYFQYIKHEDK